MVRISVLYPATAGRTFNLDYYVQKHMPLVKQRLGSLGLVRYEVDKGVAGGAPGSAAPFVCIGHLYFNTLAEFQSGIKAHGQELFGDVPNFTDIAPQVQIGEIVS